MGLFKDVGRKVERFKQAAKEAADEEATHRCADCGEVYYADHDSCPECGGSVEPIERETAGSDGPVGSDETVGSEERPADAGSDGD